MVPHRPALRPGERDLRRIWLRPDTDRWISTREGDTQAQAWHANVRALLKAFVTGLGNFDDDAVLKEIRGQRGLWSLRITFNPQHRLIAGFVWPGALVITNHFDRKNLEARGWRQAYDRAKAAWDQLSPLERLDKTRAALLKEFTP